MEKIRFEIGDLVRCKPEFADRSKSKLGSGYEPNLEFEITRVDRYIDSSGDVCFGGYLGNGVYEIYLELVNPKEKLLTTIL